MNIPDIYTHTYIYIYVCTCVCACATHTRTHTTHTCKHTHKYIHTFIYLSMHSCCLCVRESACASVCACRYVYNPSSLRICIKMMYLCPDVSHFCDLEPGKRLMCVAGTHFSLSLSPSLSLFVFHSLSLSLSQMCRISGIWSRGKRLMCVAGTTPRLPEVSWTA